VAQAVNPAAAQLWGTANRIAFGRYRAETACGGIQHALAEALLCAMAPTSLRTRFVSKAVHAGNTARCIPALAMQLRHRETSGVGD
jgi:hypothetical protein